MSNQFTRVPLNTNLREALVSLKAARGDKTAPHRRVIHSERADGYSAAAVQVWFGRLFPTTAVPRRMFGRQRRGTPSERKRIGWGAPDREHYGIAAVGSGITIR